MKIQTYYVRSRKLFLPFKFPQEVFGKNDTLRYFIYSEGYKKTLAYDIVEIEIPDSKDNLDDIREVNDKFGKAICMEYLITDNSIYWKRHLFNIAIMTDMSQKECDLLVGAFKLCSVCQLFDIRFANPIPNTLWLDEWLIKEHGYNINVHGSMNEFIKSTFGNDVLTTLKTIWKLDSKKVGKIFGN